MNSGAQHRPFLVDRVDAAGGIVTRTRLFRYEDAVSGAGSASAWPRTIEWEVYEPSSGLLLASISMVLETVSVNNPADIDQSVFDIQSLPPASTTVYNGVVQP